MSWSVIFIGKPEKVAEALEANSAKLSDQSKVEYDSALPHLVALTKENFGNGDSQLIKLMASGHGYATGGEQKQRTFACSVEVFYATLV